MIKKILLIIVLLLTFFSTSCIYLDKYYIDMEDKTYSIIVKDYDYGVELGYFQNDAQTWNSHDDFEEYFNALKGKVFLRFTVWGNDEYYLSKLKIKVVDEQTNKESKCQKTVGVMKLNNDSIMFFYLSHYLLVSSVEKIDSFSSPKFSTIKVFSMQQKNAFLLIK